MKLVEYLEDYPPLSKTIKKGTVIVVANFVANYLIREGRGKVLGDLGKAGGRGLFQLCPTCKRTIKLSAHSHEFVLGKKG